MPSKVVRWCAGPWAYPAVMDFRGDPINQPEDELRQLLGRNLQAARTAAREGLGFTQLDVSERMGVNKATVSAWETGRGVPDALRLRALARMYGTTTDSLLSARPLSTQAVGIALAYDMLPPAARDTLRSMCEAYFVGHNLPKPPQDDAAHEDEVARKLIERTSGPQRASSERMKR